MLDKYIKDRLKEKDILLMTHIVLGYPDYETSKALVRAMVAAGVDLMELQIPFSEPFADGPVILAANQEALAAGATVAKCFDCAEELAGSLDIPFLFMSYLNILFKRGMDTFAKDAAGMGMRGTIVPDAPPEETGDYLEAMAAHGLDPIQLFAPNTTPERMAYLAGHARGFVYCVARKGVTGENTTFSQELDAYLARCRAATDLPLALGFGVADKTDVDFLKGKADIAVVGSAALRVLNEKGVDAVGEYIAGLR